MKPGADGNFILDRGSEIEAVRGGADKVFLGGKLPESLAGLGVAQSVHTIRGYSEAAMFPGSNYFSASTVVDYQEFVVDKNNVAVVALCARIELNSGGLAGIINKVTGVKRAAREIIGASQKLAEWR
jgi:hypothetical protein